MKKLGIIAMACALLLGMSQCKKDNATTPTNEGEKVRITLNVGSSNAKHEVTPETGVVTFTNGDVLYVASNGVYVGALTYNGTQFAGDIIEPTEGEKLHFYFLGKVNPEETLTEGSTTGCSVVISDQTTNLPVISYNTSRENYQLGKTDYNATLLNKCALVKFNVTTSSTTPTFIMGMNNKVSVNFNPETEDDRFSYDQDGEGILTLTPGSGDRWAILLPQDAVDNTSACSSDGCWTGTCGEISSIVENDYLTDGIPVTINIPVGAINSLFSVSATQQVYFSKGNLQYIGSAATPYWQFAENQWDYLGTTTGQNSSSQTADRDLFCWGTSGYNHGAVCYQPWATSTNFEDYHPYGNSTYNLYDQTGQADWGYNAINNGCNQENSGWRTLTKEEWVYVFNTRSGIRYAKATVNGVNGVVLLPDNWTASTYALNRTNNSAADFTANTITAEDWANTLEANGAVFLPAAGRRYGSSLSTVGSNGYYWSSSYATDYTARCIYFHSGDLLASNYTNHFYGHSVRLVRSAQ